MGDIQGADRKQVILLPDTLDDYAGGDNEVRAIDAFIDSLDIVLMGFKADSTKEGRPGYNSCDILKLYMYGCQSHPFLQTAAEGGIPGCGTDAASQEGCSRFSLHCRLPKR